MFSLPNALYLSVKGYDVLVYWQHWMNMYIKGQSEHMWMMDYNYPKPLSRIAWVWYFGDIVSSLVAQLGKIYLHMAELDVRALHSQRNKVTSTLLTNRSLRLMTESSARMVGEQAIIFWHQAETICLYGLVDHAAVKERFHDNNVALRVKREQIVNKPAIRYPKQVQPVAAGAQEECCSSKEALSLHLAEF